MRILLSVQNDPILHTYTYLANFWCVVAPRMRVNESDANIEGLKWTYPYEEVDDF